MIEGQEQIRDAYRDVEVARKYVQQRFREPLGAMVHARQIARMLGVIRDHRPYQVLEIAPGPARLTADLAPALARPGTAMDASAQMLAEARASLTSAGHTWRLVQGDAFQLPFAGPFDLVYSFRLIRHFDDADRARLYAQIAQILRPGGLLVFDAVNEVVSRPLRTQPGGGGQHYDALLTPAAIRNELEAAGFTLVRLDGVQHRFPAMYRLQVLVGPRSRALARAGMELLDRIPGGQPLEWVVTCERR
jgi:SAM-dependent methyltransferase